MSEDTHQGCVDAWCEAQTGGLSTAQLLPLFDSALAAVWQRAYRTLGDATVRAIMHRVLTTAVDKHAVLSFLKLEADGIRSDGLAGHVHSREELIDAMRFLLVEFLTVLGNLTADILTPALHADLCAAPPGEARARGAETSRRVREPKA